METLQSYAVAESCIEAGVNYCDLADCRTFVNGISVLDARPREAGVAILSGCNSVPTLSSAIIDEQRHHFKRIDSIEHGISSSAKTPGLSTIEGGGLAYAGKPIRQLRNGQLHEVNGLVRDHRVWAAGLRRWGTWFERFGDGKSATYTKMTPGQWLQLML
jgi:saccharopine dehydrogenase-like NADP-dependent oxidoreductase